MIEYLLTIYFWGVTVFSILVTVLICFCAFPFVDQKTFARIYEVVPGTIILYCMLIPNIWSVKIIDKRKEKSWWRNHVIVSNHLSFLDSVIIGIIPLKKKFMIAEVFTKIPVFGWLALNSGFVTADRNNPELNKDAVEKAVEAVNRDCCSFMLYPEGRRELKPYSFEIFKTGAFRIAKDTGLSILPITLIGTYEALRFGGMVGFSDIVMVIDEPFFVRDDYISNYIEKTKTTMFYNLF